MSQDMTTEERLFGPAQRLVELVKEANEAQPAALPDRLPISAIAVEADVFQPRDGTSERHVSELVRAIANVGELDPIVVAQVGQKAYLIDGHHRLEAYKAAKWSKDIPVRYFEGSLQEAVLAAGEANTQAKLPMVNKERQNYAWRLVLLGGYSKERVAKAAGVSKSQVANMRRVKATLEDLAFGHRSWWKAREAAGGRSFDMTDDEREQWKQEMADRWADQLAKTFSTTLARHPEVAAMALATYFGRRLQDVVMELREHVGPPEEDEDSDF